MEPILRSIPMARAASDVPRRTMSFAAKRLRSWFAVLWKEAMGKDFDEEGLAEALMKVYDVEPSQAREDVAAMVAEWKKVGMVEEG